MDPNAIIEIFRRTIVEHYIDFQGRCVRRDFWYYVLAYIVVYVALAIVQSLFGSRILTGLYSLALLLPGLGISIRRLHDVDRSGWWILIVAIPSLLLLLFSTMALVGGAVGPAFLYVFLLPIVSLAATALLIYWYAQPGTPGQNRFGPAPPAATPDTTATA